jgi:hypothetical protein
VAAPEAHEAHRFEAHRPEGHGEYDCHKGHDTIRTKTKDEPRLPSMPHEHATEVSASEIAVRDNRSPRQAQSQTPG